MRRSRKSDVGKAGKTMKYERSEDGKKLYIELDGEIDAVNAADIESVLMQEIEGVTELTFDLKGLEYISSAGLRVLLMIQKTMAKNGKMVIKNASDDVKGIFKVTGFLNLLNISE